MLVLAQNTKVGRDAPGCQVLLLVPSTKVGMNSWLPQLVIDGADQYLVQGLSGLSELPVEQARRLGEHVELQ